MSSALARLKQEQRSWCKNHPFKFFASPAKRSDGTIDYFSWECNIPGKDGTTWEGGYYKLRLFFNHDYPTQPPRCVFVPSIFHPNVYPSGLVSLSTFCEKKGWRNSITIVKILLNIQQLLAKPNEHDPVCPEAVRLFCYNKLQYDKRIKKQAKALKPTDIRCQCGCIF